MNNNTLLAVCIVIVALAGALTWYFWPSGYQASEITLSELGLGTRDISNVQDEGSTSSDPGALEGFSYKNVDVGDIQVKLPFPGAITGTEFTLRGHVRDEWLNGKTLTVFVYDGNGNELTLAPVTLGSSSGGMSTFTSEVSVLQTYSGNATVVIVRNDPQATADSASFISFSITIKP